VEGGGDQVDVVLGLAFPPAHGDALAPLGYLWPRALAHCQPAGRQLHLQLKALQALGHQGVPAGGPVQEHPLRADGATGVAVAAAGALRHLLQVVADAAPVA